MVTIGTDTHGKPVALTHRAEGTYILGKNGTGKSTLILSMICADIAAGGGVCVMDPHGDLVRETIERLPRHRHNDVILFDAGCDTIPPGFDLFAFQGEPTRKNRARHVRRTTAAFMKTMPAANANRLKNLLRLIALTFLDNPGNTLTEVERVLFDADFRRRLAANVENPLVKRHWEALDKMSGTALENYAESTLTRIRDWLYDELILPIVGQAGAGIDFRWAMDNRKIVLINLSKGDIDEDNTNTLGIFLMDRILAATYSRVDVPFAARVPFSLYVDEFQNFATPDFGKFFTEARKYKVALTAAHQMRGLLSEDLRAGSLGAQNQIIYTTEPDDARALSRGLRTPESIEGLPPWEESDWEPELITPRKARVRTPLLPAVVPTRPVAPAKPLHDLHTRGHDDPDITIAGQRAEELLATLRERWDSEIRAVFCATTYRNAAEMDLIFDSAKVRRLSEARIEEMNQRCAEILAEWERFLAALAAGDTGAWAGSYRLIRALANSQEVHKSWLSDERALWLLRLHNQTTPATRLLVDQFLKELETLGKRYAKYYEWEEPPPPEPEEEEEEEWTEPPIRNVDLAHVLAQQPNYHAFAKILTGSGFWQGWLTTPTWEEKPPIVNSPRMIALLMDHWHRRAGLPVEDVERQILARQGRPEPASAAAESAFPDEAPAPPVPSWRR